MAHMIPAEIPSHGPGARAEKAIFTALREQLDDNWFVYSRLGYIDDIRHTQGEVDFLLVHRTRGLLVVECKGDGVRRTGSGRWERQTRGHWHVLREGPFEQAERTRYELVDKLYPRIRSMIPDVYKFPFIHGHAVAFPFARVDAFSLPLNEPRALFIDADDMDSLRSRIEACLALWASKVTYPPDPLEDWQFRVFRRKVLHPQLHVVDSLAGHLKEAQRTLVRLTRQQAQSVEGVLGNRRFLIRGGAGTGKTVLALEAAKRLADRGMNVLLLCFNKALRNHLRLLVTEEYRDRPEGKLEVNSFSALNADAFKQLGYAELPVPGTDSETESFWNEEAPAVFVEALKQKRLPRYDAIVVDEAQDFARQWWDVLEQMVTDDGRILAFYDPSQEIFGRGHHMPDWPVFELSFNFRNTIEITKVLNLLGDVHMQCHEQSPEGEPPVVIAQQSVESTLLELNRLVSSLTREGQLEPDQIAILTPHRRVHSTLAGVTEIAGIAISEDPLDRDRQILHATIGAFKGLESDVLILLDIDPEDPRCSRNARYVAASRARFRLYVFSRGDWMK